MGHYRTWHRVLKSTQECTLLHFCHCNYPLLLIHWSEEDERHVGQTHTQLTAGTWILTPSWPTATWVRIGYWCLKPLKFSLVCYMALSQQQLTATVLFQSKCDTIHWMGTGSLCKTSCPFGQSVVPCQHSMAALLFLANILWTKMPNDPQSCGDGVVEPSTPLQRLLLFFHPSLFFLRNLNWGLRAFTQSKLHPP